jgi:indolepyruvate ferredoxin oxidoreductase alpha subunit
MNENAKLITKILAQGFVDGGMGAAFNYPGFFSHELFSLVGGTEIQLSEKHTYAEAFGSSLAGKRTLVSFKNVGLNVAADTFLHSIIGGVGAGLVLLITDDIDVWGSQESQDSRHFIDFYGGILLEPKNIQDAYDIARGSFALSESLNLPVVIRITNQHLIMMNGTVERKDKLSIMGDVTTRKEDVIVHPYYWASQYQSLQDRMKRVSFLEAYDEFIPFHSATKRLVILFGATQTIESSILNDTKSADILRVGLLPLSKGVRDLVINPRYEEIIVVEYGQAYVHEKVSALSSQPVQSVIPDILADPKQFTEWVRDERLFKAVEKVKNETGVFVFSDITRSTVESRHVVDASLSYGAAVSTGIGFAKSAQNGQFVMSIVGDGSLNHEGLDVLNYAAKHDVNVTVVIVDNGGLWCTGGQVPAISIEAAIRSYGHNIVTVDIETDSLDSIKDALTTAVNNKGFSLMVAKATMGSFRGE